MGKGGLGSRGPDGTREALCLKREKGIAGDVTEENVFR